MDNNTYRLVIDINDNAKASEKQNPITQPQSTSETTTSQETSGGTSSGASGLEAVANAGVALAIYNVAVKPFIDSTKQILMNDIQVQTGSTELTSRISFGLQMAKSIVSPVSFIQSIASYLTSKSQLESQQLLENQQLSILRGRAGIQFNRSRSGE